MRVPVLVVAGKDVPVPSVCLTCAWQRQQGRRAHEPLSLPSRPYVLSAIPALLAQSPPRVVVSGL